MSKSYSQTNPWSLSVKGSKNSSRNSNNNTNKKPEIDFNELENNTFRTAHQALICNQMLAGKSNYKNLLDSSDASSGLITSATQSNHETNYHQASISSSQPARSIHTNTNQSNLPPYQPFQPNYSTQNKRLGVTGPYRNPMRKQDDGQSGHFIGSSSQSNSQSSNSNHYSNSSSSSHAQNNNTRPVMKVPGGSNGQMSAELLEIMSDERAKNLDAFIVEKILNEIIDKKSEMIWDQIGGLHKIKEELEEIVILPMKRPDLFVDLLSPCKGLLLFGPPGTGKTLIGRCIASQSNSTFFSISASSLTSKWIGEAEKLVRALFVIARIRQPSVIFIDEIDSLLTQRSEDEHESSRRIKTEFLVQFDGMTSDSRDNLLVIGATNLPNSLDEAARRRFTKRLYIPLPDLKARREIINLSMQKCKKVNLDQKQLLKLCKMTKGYSGADLAQLCKDAALNIIRRFGKSKIMEIKDGADLPAIEMGDFLNAIQRVKPSVSNKDLAFYKDWNQQFGAIAHYDEDDDDDFVSTENRHADDSLVILN